jgi:hypothetical protein
LNSTDENNHFDDEQEVPERKLSKPNLSADKEDERDYPPLTLLEAWRMAVTRPNTTTFQHIIHDPKLSYQRVFTGLLIAGLAVPLSVLLLFVILFPGEITDIGIATGVFNTFVRFLAFVVLFFVVVGLSHFSANSAGKQSTTFRQAAYTFAAFMVPLTALQIILLLIPLLGLVFGFLIYLYLMYLTVVVLQNLYQLRGLQLLVAALPMAAYILFQMSAPPA